MDQLLQILLPVVTAVLASVGTGIIASTTTVAALKTDIGWLKQISSRAHERIDSVEHRVANLESRCAARSTCSPTRNGALRDPVT